jgi:hypothetical protein
MFISTVRSKGATVGGGSAPQLVARARSNDQQQAAYAIRRCIVFSVTDGVEMNDNYYTRLVSRAKQAELMQFLGQNLANHVAVYIRELAIETVVTQSKE